MDAGSKKATSSVVNVYLKKAAREDSTKRPEEDSFPDADDLNTKYGLNSPKVLLAVDENSIRRDIVGGSDLIDKTEALIRRLAMKDNEIERLCILLETVEPIPGICVESMRKHIENTADADDCADFRDSKIVALAKKNRNLTVLLNKERASADSRGLHNQQLIDRVKQLESKDSGHSKRDGSSADSQNDLLAARRELLAANKSVEDLRRKLFQSTEENKKLSRALQNELGESATVDQAVEGTWRGRAQQIIMLKSKIKKLSSAVDDNVSSATMSTAGTVSRGKRSDVDTMAQEELAEMSLERKHAIESIFEEKEALLKGNQQLEERVQAHRARIKNLEADASRQKQQIKLVLDVKEGDDELIDALQQEIQRFKVHAKTNGGTVGAAAKVSQNHEGQRSNAVDVDAIVADATRLRRLCKSQADQINTQDEVIRSLRSRLG